MGETGERIVYIDLAKAFCIMLVVYVHITGIGEGGYLGYCTDLVRLPFFFFLSGFFFKRYSSAGEFVVRKTNRLLVPYLFFYAVGTVTGYVLNHVAGYGGEPLPMGALLAGDLNALAHGRPTEYNSPIWFLLSLYTVSIMYYLIDRMIRSVWVQLAVCFALSVLQDLFFPGGLPLYLCFSLGNLPFYCMGHIVRPYLDRWMETGSRAGNAVRMAVPLVVVAAAGFLPETYREIYPVRMFISVSGVFFMFRLAKCIGRMPVLSYVGRYSIVVLGFHAFMVAPLRAVFSFLPHWLCVGATLVFIVVIMRAAVIPFALRFFPKLVAQDELIRYRRK